MKTFEKPSDVSRHLNVEWVAEQWSVPVRVFLSPGMDLNARLRSQVPPVSHPVWGGDGRQMESPSPSRWAFTLIELLVVIAIIAILAGLLLPTLGRVQERGKINQAKSEMQSLAAAIASYQNDYSLFPLANPGEIDTTYTNNSEIMVMLLDVDTSGESDPVRMSWNNNSARNPRHIVYLQVKETDSGLGSGLDGSKVFRDPWGTSYEITLDVNGDNKCPDPEDPGNKPPISRAILVRSYGPDRTANTSDDIQSWK